MILIFQKENVQKKIQEKKIVISKNLKIPGLQPRISQSLQQFFLTVGQNNFGNKIPITQHLHELFVGQSLKDLSWVLQQRPCST